MLTLILLIALGTAIPLGIDFAWRRWIDRDGD